METTASSNEVSPNDCRQDEVLIQDVSWSTRPPNCPLSCPPDGVQHDARRR